MTDPDSPPPPAPLTLPPSAVLSTARRAPHPDSEEYRQEDRHRTAKELDQIPPSSSPHISIQQSPNVGPQASSSRSPYVRARGGSTRSSPYLRARPRGYSNATTAPDEEGEREQNRYRLRRQKPRWYDPIAKFWKSQISPSIEEGAYRDHLGECIPLHYMHFSRQDVSVNCADVHFSTRTYLSGLPPHFCSPCHDGCHHSAALPPPTFLSASR